MKKDNKYDVGKYVFAEGGKLPLRISKGPIYSEPLVTEDIVTQYVQWEADNGGMSFVIEVEVPREQHDLAKVDILALAVEAKENEVRKTFLERKT
jgi:hypothetical protein